MNPAPGGHFPGSVPPPDQPRPPWVAAMYDYYLGGTANEEIDRAAAEKALAVMPEIRQTAWANRGFLQRAVTRMAAEWGITQFLDLGAGLPTQRHTHEVVAEVAPDCRVVYVDNDPMVVERGRLILADEPRVSVVDADIRDWRGVLEHPDTTRLIDFSRPVGLLAVAVIQWIPQADDPFGLMARYLQALVPGSYLALTVPTTERQAERRLSAISQVYNTTNTPGFGHGLAEVEDFFSNLEIVEPYEGAGPRVVYVGQWGAEDPEEADDDPARWVYAAVGRKP